MTMRQKTQIKTYKMIDLFAGIGGIRLGFQNTFKSQAKFVMASEIDEKAQKTYFTNYKNLPLGDITKIRYYVALAQEKISKIY